MGAAKKFAQMLNIRPTSHYTASVIEFDQRINFTNLTPIIHMTDRPIRFLLPDNSLGAEIKMSSATCMSKHKISKWILDYEPR